MAVGATMIRSHHHWKEQSKERKLSLKLNDPHVVTASRRRPLRSLRKAHDNRKLLRGKTNKLYFDDVTLGILFDKGYSADEIASWAWVMSGHDTDTVAGRYETLPRAPNFLVLEILSRDVMSPEALRILIVDWWQKLLLVNTKADPEFF